VFTGGCTLDAAAAVAGCDVETVQSLVEKSLVRHTADRYWMLETIREYALEHLAASGEEGRVRRAHPERLVRTARVSGVGHEARASRPRAAGAREHLRRPRMGCRARSPPGYAHRGRAGAVLGRGGPVRGKAMDRRVPRVPRAPDCPTRKGAQVLRRPALDRRR